MHNFEWATQTLFIFLISKDNESWSLVYIYLINNAN